MSKEAKVVDTEEFEDDFYEDDYDETEEDVVVEESKMKSFGHKIVRGVKNNWKKVAVGAAVAVASGLLGYKIGSKDDCTDNGVDLYDLEKIFDDDSTVAVHEEN